MNVMTVLPLLKTIKNSDSDVLNSSNITGQGQTVVDNPKGQKGKKVGSRIRSLQLTLTLHFAFVMILRW